MVDPGSEKKGNMLFVNLNQSFVEYEGAPPPPLNRPMRLEIKFDRYHNEWRNE